MHPPANNAGYAPEKLFFGNFSVTIANHIEIGKRIQFVCKSYKVHLNPFQLMFSDMNFKHSSKSSSSSKRSSSSSVRGD